MKKILLLLSTIIYTSQPIFATNKSITYERTSGRTDAERDKYAANRKEILELIIAKCPICCNKPSLEKNLKGFFSCNNNADHGRFIHKKCLKSNTGQELTRCPVCRAPRTDGQNIRQDYHPTAWAEEDEDEEEDEDSYELDGDTAVQNFLTQLQNNPLLAQAINDLSIRNSLSLTTLPATLTTINGSLHIYNCPALTTLPTSLTTINGYLYIHSCPALTTLPTTLTTINENLILDSNPALISLGGLTSVTGYVAIDNCPRLIISQELSNSLEDRLRRN